MSRIPLDPDAIRALASLLAETGLSEIEIAEKDSRIRVVRAVATQLVPATAPASAAEHRGPTRAIDTSPPPREEEQLAARPGAVLSPMVGVVYLSPEPGAAPFVTIGQQVAAQQTVLLIEAMKTFNQIKAPIAGTVARILVGNSSPVEYGEVLILIEP